MPWLDEPNGELFFVHVPRCAGTSVTKHCEVRKKARKGKDCYHKAGLFYFFYRYDLLEKANFPFITVENGFALLEMSIGLILFYNEPSAYPSWIIMWTFCSLLFLTSTFVASAPCIGRVRAMRRIYLLALGKWLCGFGEGREMVTGCGEDGWLLHFTAEKVIRYKYATEQDIRTKSFAIVRNPYSRMVSIYMYNRVWGESFPTFVKRFRKEINPYLATGTTDDWNVYCHALPMHAYTHDGDRQLVPTIIRQEELKFLFFQERQGGAQALHRGEKDRRDGRRLAERASGDPKKRAGDV